MKFFNNKKLLSFLLVTGIAVSLVACGTPKSPAESSSAAETVETSTAEAVETDGPWYKYPQTVTLTRGGQTSAATKWASGDDYDNNPWTRAAMDMLNIQLKSYWTADTSQYVNKLNISIASQDIPDVLAVNSNQLAQLVNSGLIQDLSDVFQKNASPLLKQFEEADIEGFESGKFDGKLMGISKQHFGVISKMYSVWIRDDWMKKLGLNPPETMQDLVNICEKFTRDDPDGNGKNDTYGLAVDKSLVTITNLMNAFHAYPTIWIRDSNNQVAYGSIQPEMKQGLKLFQEMYQKGIISKEFGIMDGAKVNEDLISGKVGVQIQQSWLGYSPGPDIVKRNGADAIFKPYPIPSADVQPVKLSVQWPVGYYLVVSRNCKNPEAAVRMLNLYVHKNNETTGEEYNTFVANEVKWGGTPFDLNNPNADYAQCVAIIDALKTNDSSKLRPDQLGKYEFCVKWRDGKDLDSVGYWTQVGPESAYDKNRPFVDNKRYVTSEFHGISTPTMAEKQSTLQSMETEVLTKIIMGEPLDSFDTFVSNWKKLGGDDIAKELNELY